MRFSFEVNRWPWASWRSNSLKCSNRLSSIIRLSACFWGKGFADGIYPLRRSACLQQHSIFSRISSRSTSSGRQQIHSNSATFRNFRPSWNWDRIDVRRTSSAQLCRRLSTTACKSHRSSSRESTRRPSKSEWCLSVKLAVLRFQKKNSSALWTVTPFI